MEKNKAKILIPLFESISDQVLVLDDSLKVIFMNQAFVKAGTSRFGAEFIVGENICNDSKKSLIVDEKIWQKALSGQDFSLTEEQVVEKSKKNYFEIRFTPIMSDKKKLLGAVAFIKDITLLRRAEIELIENRITLQETQVLAGISRWSFSLLGEEATWDDSLNNLFGTPSSEQKNKQNLLSLFSEYDLKNLFKKIDFARENHEANLVFDTTVNHPKLGQRYIHTLGRIDDDSFTGISHDITEIKSAELSLASQNRELENTKKAMLNVLEDAQALEKKTQEKVYQLSAILSSMREGLVAVDSKLRIVLINQSAAALFRIAPDDAIGQPVDKVCVFYQNDKKILAKDSIFKKTISENTIISYGINDNVAVLDQSKIMTPVACTFNSLMGDLPVSAIMIIRDITKEKEIDSAKNELISLASHQLRTPLSSVNWYSEMLLSGDAGPVNEDQKNYLLEIHKGNLRMIELVNSLLNVSRVDMGTLSIEVEEVSIEEICKNVIADLAVLINEKKIKIETKIPAKFSKYLGDKKMLVIILQNLISNSVKYTPNEGLIKIKVENKNKGEIVSEHELKQDSIIISVEDNGYGIPEKDKSKIFQKLYRANNVKEKETNGNGLGLYLVKSMINSFGGGIWFNSKEKIGTTFFVALPAKGMKKKIGTTFFT